MFYESGMGVGGWILIFLAVGLLVLLVVVMLVSSQPPTRRQSAERAPHSVATAEQVLADRLARGDIDSEEYEQRLRTLRANRP